MSTRASSLAEPSAHTGPPRDGGAKRLFELLDADSQERVVLLKARYEQMLSLERAAFLQELGLVSTHDLDEEHASGKLAVRKSDQRLAAVQSRDEGFVVLQQDAMAAADESPFLSAAERAAAAAQRQTTVGQPMSDLSLRRLLTDSLFGEAPVTICPERQSLYEKIGALEGDEAEAEKEKRALLSREAEASLHRKSALAPKPVATIGAPGEYLYRSNAYQILRLAHSFPAPINLDNSTHARTGEESTDTVPTSATVNMTGIPIYEDELRRWFDAMDTAGTGLLSYEAFLGFMRSLDRNFGVAAEYEQLERDGERLAMDGKLSFEAFAYLVLRFARV